MDRPCAWAPAAAGHRARYGFEHQPNRRRAGAERLERSRLYYRADAAFAVPGVYEYLEDKRIKYAIRLPVFRDN